MSSPLIVYLTNFPNLLLGYGLEKRFEVHSAIISCRSDYFEALLSHGMTEASSGEVVISDISCAALAEIIHFIYTNEVRWVQFSPKSSIYCCPGTLPMHATQLALSKHLAQEVCIRIGHRLRKKNLM